MCFFSARAALAFLSVLPSGNLLFRKPLYPRPMRLFPTRNVTNCLSAALALAALTGCHSHYVSIDIHNTSSQAVSVVELDYPSASFGVETLAAGATYHYRFKILGDGPTKLLWTDAAQHEHTVPGPALSEGQEGTLSADITPSTATWSAHLKP